MFRLSMPAAALAWCALFAAPTKATDPLDFVPPSAQAVIVADHPKQLAEAVTALEVFQKGQQLGPVRDLYDNTEVRRGLQLLAFAEKELGAKWPELLDQLAGNGIAVALRFEDGPALLVLSGKDEKQSEKAFNLAVRVIEEELARQGNEAGLKRKTYRDVEAVAIGNDLFFTRMGATILVSNKSDALKAAVDHAKDADGTRKPHPARKAAFTLLPKNPLAWAWVDLVSVKQSQAAKDFYASTRKDFLQTLVLGATIDHVYRADFLALGLYQEKSGFRATLRLPAGRDGMWEHLALHIPPKGEPGTLPLLEPPGTIASHNLYLDIGYLWKNREEVLNEEIRNGIEEGEKQISRVLPANFKLGELLEMWGPYHRVVVANHDKRPYKTVPGLELPAFGYVASARDPKFAEAVAPVLRSAGLVGYFQFGLKMTEHEHEGVKLVSYRFPEDKPLADDPDGIRFNFEPCFAVVGEELMLASTVELGKKLITELKKPRSGKSSPAVLHGRLSAKGASQALAGFTDSLVTDAVLTRGISLPEAKQEIADLLKLIDTLGTLDATLTITDTQYQVDVVWKITKN